MSADTDEPNIVSLSGSPIFHHSQPLPWEAVKGEECLEVISEHIEANLGPIEAVLHEIASDTVHIDVHVVGATSDFPFCRLVTSGMSDLPMSVPAGAEVPAYIELHMTLPHDWRLNQSDFEDERWYWPIRLLKTLARLPHKHRTWLGWGHTIPNGDPAEPYSSQSALCGALIMPSVSVPDSFRQLTVREDKVITFLSVVPLHKGEMDLKLRAGTDALTDRFDRYKITDIIDPARRDVSKRRFWLL